MNIPEEVWRSKVRIEHNRRFDQRDRAEQIAAQKGAEWMQIEVVKLCEYLAKLGDQGLPKQIRIQIAEAVKNIGTPNAWKER